MEPLPTRAQFATRQREYERRIHRVFVKTLVLWGVVVVAGIAIVIATADRDEMVVWGFVGFAMAMAAIFGGAFNLDRQRSIIAKQAEVCCRSCGKALSQGDAKLALTTGRCAYCGDFVVSESPPSSDE